MKSWKKTHRQRKRKFGLTRIRLSHAVACKLRILALQWGVSMERAFHRVIKEGIMERERTKNKQG